MSTRSISARAQQRIRQQQRRQLRPGLRLENLEDRKLLAADYLQSLEPDQAARILVSYQGEQSAVVQHVAANQQAIDSALAALRADPTVRYAEVDYRVKAAVVPNDPRYSETWGLNSSSDIDVDAPEAWDVTTGSTKTVVAVIDSGIDYTHPDLYQNVWINQSEIPTTIKSLLVDVDNDSLITFRDLNDSRNQGAGMITDQNSNGRIDGGDLLAAYRSDGLGGWADGTSNDGDTYVDDLVGWNFVNNTNNPYDDNGHGTHVAGTIGAQGNNGVGVSGLLWSVQLVGLKFLDADGGGYTSSAVAALNYAVSKAVEISNNSWGGGGYSQAMYDAINNARAKGHIFIAAAGNGGVDGIGDDNNLIANYPSNYNLDNVVSVAATDRYDRLASFSNYGSKTVDLAAPGVSILSTIPGGYAAYSGTSMATPHVTGAAALVLSQHSDWSYSQIISQLLNNTDAVSGLSGKVATGGRLNAVQALNGSTTVAPPPATTSTGPRVVSATPNLAANGGVAGVRLTFSEAISPSSFTTADITGFAGPSGALSIGSVAVVSGSGNKQFDVKFSTKTAAGDYTFQVGPNVLDVDGTAMDQDQDGVNGESTQDRYTTKFTINPAYTYTTTPYAAIRDGYATDVTITVDRDITIADLNVRLDISHTYDADLAVYLTGPDGTRVDLVIFRGGSGDNMRPLLNDEATSSIASGAAPFSSSYRPEQSLTAFDGKIAKGTWTLSVEDWYLGYTGRVNSVSLVFASVSSSTTAAALSDPALVAVRMLSLPTTTQAVQAQPSSVQQSNIGNKVRETKQQLVDTFFGAVQHRRSAVQSLVNSVRAAVKSSPAAFGWDAAVDEFMALLAKK